MFIKMKHNIANAIFTIETVANLGFEGLRAFGLTREKPHILENSFAPDEETYDEFIDRISSVCWMGADYFRMWLGDENKKLMEYKLNNIDDIFNNNGVYYMNFEGEESHFWVWIINNNDIWYAGTYGNTCSIMVNKFNKNYYKTRFNKMLGGSLSDYAYVFQIDQLEINAVKYKSISYIKSNRY